MTNLIIIGLVVTKINAISTNQKVVGEVQETIKIEADAIITDLVNTSLQLDSRAWKINEISKIWTFNPTKPTC